jgi:hypothetical protein
MPVRRGRSQQHAMVESASWRPGPDSAGFQVLIYATGTELFLNTVLVHTYCAYSVGKYIYKVSEGRRRGMG